MPFSFLRSVDEFMVPVNAFITLGIGWLFAVFGRKLESTADIAGTEGQNFIPPKFIPLFIALFLCVFPGFLAYANFRFSSMSHHTFAQDQARNVLEQVPYGGLLVVSGDESFLFEYLQEVRGIRQDVELVVYPFVVTVADKALSSVDSLVQLLNNQPPERAVVFSFSPPEEILTKLSSPKPKALRLDGIALSLVDREPDQPSTIIGHPNIWMTYQLRNLDPVTLGSLVLDDFEYETFDRYVNGLNAAVVWLDTHGYGRDESRVVLREMAEALEEAAKRTDYPSPKRKR